jgi:thioredoxin reductase
MAPLVDALIIGGGPAGLTVALTLARQVQSSLVFDDSNYRNKKSSSMHLVLTQDSESPADFRIKARENIEANYNTVSFEETSIIRVKKIKGGFEAENAAGKSWQGKKLILATGVQDLFPAIDGYEECWGKGMYVLCFLAIVHPLCSPERWQRQQDYPVTSR